MNKSNLTIRITDEAKEILEETGVAVAPGADFGTEGEGFLRFSYCNSIENIEKGIARIGEYLARRGTPPE